MQNWKEQNSKICKKNFHYKVFKWQSYEKKATEIKLKEYLWNINKFSCNLEDPQVHKNLFVHKNKNIH